MSETGHAKNVEHFQEMISFVGGYGAAYAPTNASISLAQLNTALTNAQGGYVSGMVSSWIANGCSLPSSDSARTISARTPSSANVGLRCVIRGGLAFQLSILMASKRTRVRRSYARALR